MRGLVFVAMILALFGMARGAVEAEAQLPMEMDVVQAQQYDDITTLLCKWRGDSWESFRLNGPFKRGSTEIQGWTVTRITPREYSIEVRLDNPNGDIFYVDFNNGWPCKVETQRTLIRPESDDFVPLED